jgi:hypothetical protein
MKPEHHFLPPRSAVIFGATRRMLDATALCVRKFGARVAEEYAARVAPDLRQVPFRAGVTLDDLCKAERHNAQIISRYMDGTVKALPADLEDAWVCALPEPYRAECERELARRRGHLPVRLSAPSESAETMTLGRLMSEVGDLCAALAPALADGRLTEADLPHARRILDESDDVIAAVLGLRRQVQALLPGDKQGRGVDA